MENQGKIKVLIITENGTELVNGEYEGVIFHGITEKHDRGFNIHKAIHGVSPMQAATMIDSILEERDDVRKWHAKILMGKLFQSLNSKGAEKCKQ